MTESKANPIPLMDHSIVGLNTADIEILTDHK